MESADGFNRWCFAGSMPLRDRRAGGSKRVQIKRAIDFREGAITGRATALAADEQVATNTSAGVSFKAGTGIKTALNRSRPGRPSYDVSPGTDVSLTGVACRLRLDWCRWQLATLQEGDLLHSYHNQKIRTGPNEL